MESGPKNLVSQPYHIGNVLVIKTLAPLLLLEPSWNPSLLPLGAACSTLLLLEALWASVTLSLKSLGSVLEVSELLHTLLISSSLISHVKHIETPSSGVVL